MGGAPAGALFAPMPPPAHVPRNAAGIFVCAPAAEASSRTIAADAKVRLTPDRADTPSQMLATALFRLEGERLAVGERDADEQQLRLAVAARPSFERQLVASLRHRPPPALRFE